jgi:hypothetical protein
MLNQECANHLHVWNDLEIENGQTDDGSRNPYGCDAKTHGYLENNDYGGCDEVEWCDFCTEDCEIGWKAEKVELCECYFVGVHSSDIQTS